MARIFTEETMIDENLLNRLPKSATVICDAPMCEYTTFGLGGRCRALIDCPDAETLADAAKVLLDAEEEFMVIGQGSNLLVCDAGIDVAVLRYCSEKGHPQVQIEGVRVQVSGNTLLDDLAAAAVENGRGDITFCCGIPGTVAGAIVGNAGAFGRQIGDVVESVRVMEGDGRIQELKRDELGFEYRSSALKQSGAIVLEAVLRLEAYDQAAMQTERERIMELRRTKHPNWKTTPCAGSVFRNVEPSSSAERRQAAGWFLEQAGAKEFRIGGAHLFDQHANIIVVDPDATAMDVFRLTEQMIAAVREKFGIELSREIKLVGEF